MFCCVIVLNSCYFLYAQLFIKNVQSEQTQLSLEKSNEISVECSFNVAYSDFHLTKMSFSACAFGHVCAVHSPEIY